MKKILISLYLVWIVAVAAGGCTHLESGPIVTASAKERWAILPMQNLAETHRAGERVESILHTILQNQGVRQLALSPKSDTENLALLIDDHKRLSAAKAWAKENGFRYGITGSIQEWSYKTGLDGEPAVGITLNLIDLQKNDRLLWAATASRTGWGSENLTETTTIVINALLDRMELKP